jgi:hypothetical protein
MPPSPSLSMLMATVTYFTDVTMISIQKAHSQLVNGPLCGYCLILLLEYFSGRYHGTLHTLDESRNIPAGWRVVRDSGRALSFKLRPAKAKPMREWCEPDEEPTFHFANRAET